VNRAIILIGIIAFAPRPLSADDWPMLGGRPDRNQVSSEKGLPVEFDAAKKKNVLWSVDLGTTTFSTPVVSNGRILVGTSNDRGKDDKAVLRCFDTSGKPLWKIVHDKLETGESEDAGGIGICSTPCVIEDKVYYVSNRAELVCRVAQDGKVVWSLDFRKELGVSPHQGSASSPLVVGDLVFVHTGHGVDYKKNKVLNPKAPSFIAVNRSTGKIVWQDNSPGTKVIRGQWSSPAYGVVEGRAQVIYPGGDGWLYSFEPTTGKLLWKFNCKGHEKLDAEGKPETHAQLVASPVIVGHRVIISNGVDNDEASGPGCIRAIDARGTGDITGTGELWKLAGEAFAVSISTVAVHEGLVYAIQQPGLIDCIDLETGKRIWQHDMLSVSWGSPLVADGKVYVRNGDGEVLILKTGREKKLLAKHSGLPDIDNGTPVAANGVLYFAGNKKLFAVAESK
jgi:outer membrane protein assembly factor BamB